MEFMSEDLRDKPLRHAFDRNIFIRNFGFMLIFPVCILLALILFILFGKVHDANKFAFGRRYPLPTSLLLIAWFFRRFYAFKCNDVFTVPGCVLYRKRKLFSSIFGSVHYVIYCITNVKSMRCNDVSFTVARGDIKAAYVLKDGKTLYSYKECRWVVIPNCFTDMDVIWKTLETIKENPNSSNGVYIKF